MSVRQASAELVDWVARHSQGWRPDVRLVAEPAVRVVEGQVHLGLPLVRCLRETELLVLLRDARDQLESERGGGGSWLRRRGQAQDRGAGAAERRAQYGDFWTRAAERADVVGEGWQLLEQEWLRPAREVGVWYDEPFLALRDFLCACEASGLTDGSDRLPGSEVALSLAEDEHEVAAALAPELSGSAAASRWAEHPREVTVPTWRARLERGLAVASQVAGRTVSEAVSDLLPVALYAELALAAALEQEAGGSIDDLLAAAVALWLLDGGHAELAWEWPTGTVLRNGQGDVVDPVAMVADRATLLDRFYEARA